MKIFEITYQQTETMPKRIEALAESLSLSPEQLIRRFISQGMQGFGLQEHEDISATSFNEYMHKAGVLKK